MSCEKCSSKTDLFLCSKCQDELAVMLLSLAVGRGGAGGWIANLLETALGQVKMGEMVRYVRQDQPPLKFNLKASGLYDKADTLLETWCSAVDPSLALEGPINKAQWLSERVSGLAKVEGAGDCFKAVRKLISDIQGMVDRPAPRRFCGPCPHIVDAHNQRCGMALLAHREAKEVVCSQCKSTHDIEELTARLLNELGEWLFSAYELQSIVLPALGERVSDRTFRGWVSRGLLRPSAFKRPDETFVATWSSKDDRPAYRLADVRALRNAKRQEKETGACSHKKNKVAG
jgi:hypothetical protein